MVESLPYTLNKFISDASSFAESNKSYLETQDDNAEGSAAHIDDEAHRKRRKVEPKLTTHVLGDLFHIVDRVKVQMHHNFKAVYFQALWVKFFIMDAGDAERLKNVTQRA